MLHFSWGGCRFEFHFSVFALPAFLCIFGGVTGGAFFLLAAALHEGAHLAAMFLFRAPPKAAFFSALGCRLVLDPKKSLSYRRNALVSLAGPVGNLLLFLIFALFGETDHPLAMIDLALGLLHSLPIEPLDGGLALRALLSSLMSEQAARRISAVISVLLLIPLTTAGFLILLRTGRNYSLLALSVYLMLYLVLKQDYLED